MTFYSTLSSTAALAIRNTAVAVRDLVIIKLEQVRQMLSEVATVKDAKEVLATVEAAEVYARRQQLGEEAIGYAHAVKLDALKRLGELLKVTPKNQGTRGQLIGSSNMEPPRDETPTLAEIGIDRKISMVAQRLADMPQDLFDGVRSREFSLSFALQRMERAETRAKPHSGVDIDVDIAEHRQPIKVHSIGRQEEDPIIEPVKMNWAQIMDDLAERKWTAMRIAGAMVITTSTVQRWSDCEDITFGYAYALLMLHSHVCGKELTQKHLKEAAVKPSA